MFFALIAAFGFLIYGLSGRKTPKEKQRIKKLCEKAEHDEAAKKQLARIERKNKRRRKRGRGNIINDILVWGLSLCVAGLILFWAIIPGWIDYIQKYYVVYTGEITVYHQQRPRIELEDGTTVWGRGDFDNKDTYGTIVYSRRTNLFLGGIKTAP